jgi:hypothetical protein
MRRPVNERDKLSITECRKSLKEEALKYSDEQIIMIRDWMYNFIDIALFAIEKKEAKTISEMKQEAQLEITENIKSEINEKESNHLHEGID